MRVEVVGAEHRSAVGPRSEEKMVGKLSCWEARGARGAVWWVEGAS